MNKLTAFFLLLLRLAIGWHFAAEGFHKLDGYWHWSGVTVVGTSRPFTSAGYFREGTGPLAQYIRKEIGDPDEEALRLLTPQSAESPNTPLNMRTPPLLAKEWGDYVRRFSDYYSFDEQQRKKAEDALMKAEDAAVGWLTSKEVNEKNFRAKTQEGQLPVPVRVEQYKQKLDEWLEPRHSHLVSIGSNAESVRLRNVKADVVRLRVGLLNDLDEYTQELRKDLEKIPTDEQKKAAEGKSKPPQPEPPTGEREKIWWIDQITMYALLVLGACLIAGLFTRTACLLSAGFLVMTYCTWPPFPWLPLPPNDEGYYLFVNKNVIEALALMALATTTSGRWLGLDALIHYMLFGSRRPAP
ncbi:MAG TPA: DoxX family protein [Gemmataceae bacterium]|jgi:uncharacterized membrane protein YphA (DoxX/SURF4 family)